MLGLDLTETEEAEVAGAKWTVGAVPWGKLVELRQSLADAHAAQGAALARWKANGEAPDPEVVAAFDKAHAAYLDACADVVRWGVRRTPHGRLNAAPTVPENYAGATVQTLAPAVVDVLRRVRPVPVQTTDEDGQPKTVERELLDLLAGAVLRANTVDPDDVLGFK